MEYQNTFSSDQMIWPFRLTSTSNIAHLFTGYDHFFFQGDPHTFCLCRADQYGPRLCRPRVWFWQDYQGADDEGAEYVCKHSSNHGVLLQGIRRKSSIQDTCNLQTNIHSIFANLMQVFQGGMIFIFLTHSFFQYSGCGEKKLNHTKGTASKHLRLWLTFFTTVIYFSNIFNKILKNNKYKNK